MEVVYSWVKNLVCFYIFMTAILHLLPKESYRKYVRFFTGLLLVILVLTPVLSLLGDKENLYDKISQTGFFQELDNLKLDTAHLEESQQEIYRKEYEKTIGMDIEQIARREELEVKEVSVQLTEECRLEKIYMEVEILEENGIFPQKALFSDKEEYPAVHELQKELMNVYQVEEEQMEIVVQGGRT